MNVYSNWNIGDTAYAVERYKNSVTIVKVKIVAFLVTDEVKVRVVSDDGTPYGTVPQENLHTCWYMAVNGARKALGVEDEFAPRPTARDLAAAAAAAAAGAAEAAEAADDQGVTSTAEEPF